MVIRQTLCAINTAFINLCEIVPARKTDDNFSWSRDSSWTRRERNMSGKAYIWTLALSLA